MSNKITNVEKIKTAKDIQRISLEVLKKDSKFLAILEEIEKEAKNGKFSIHLSEVSCNSDYEFALRSLGYNSYNGFVSWDIW